MSSQHEPFKALGPVDWPDVPQDDELAPFLNDIFDQSYIVVDSIPSYPGYESSPFPRSEAASALQKEWKQVKVNSKENPLDMIVYKLGTKDGKGAWFARSSVHTGLSFETWKKGLESEFAESMKFTGSPGSGNIRGIGADKRVEHKVVENTGELQVFQLSAQFPGPTSPRDFITLLLTSDLSHKQGDSGKARKQFIIVSKPCVHDECPPRQGIIRGTYESVEIIREVPVPAGGSPSQRKSHSTADLSKSHKDSSGDSGTAVEWLMITRSDPGGSVPRFMIERGTPPGIVGDAGKFLHWISSSSSKPKHSVREDTISEQAETTEKQHENAASVESIRLPVRRVVSDNSPSPRPYLHHEHTESSTYSSALYSMITGALGKASNLASGIAKQFSSLEEDDLGEDSDASFHHEKRVDFDSDASSIHSFVSALGNDDEPKESEKDAEPNVNGSTPSEESKSQSSAPATQQEKELRKLQEKRSRLEEKLAKSKERMEQKHQDEKQKDAASAAKAREKYEKELAKQEARYQKEMRKIEERRESELRKKEQKERKAMDKREKANLSLELERTRFERDEALQKLKLLEKQVEDLQEQNTGLTEKLAKAGITDDEKSRSVDALSGKSAGSG